MSHAFQNIHLLGDNAITLVHNQLVPNNPVCVDLLRVNPEDLDKPKTLTFIEAQLSHYPSRVLETLKDEYSCGTYDKDRIFDYGVHLVGAEGSIIQAMRQIFDTQCSETGDINDGLQIFERYARKLVDSTSAPEILASIKDAVKNSQLETSRQLLDDRETKLAEALDGLPKELCAAINRIGTKVVVNDKRHSSHFSNRTIYIKKDRFEMEPKHLRAVLKEEMVHYVDSFIGFTDRPEWIAACQKGIVVPKEAPSLKEIPDSPEGIEQYVEAKIALLEKDMQRLVSGHIGKTKTAEYDADKQPKEILPDILHTLDTLIEAGQNQANAKEIATGIFGKDAMDLVDQYFVEVGQVANGTHPAFSMQKHIAVGTPSEQSEVSTSGSPIRRSASSRKKSPGR